MAVNVRYLEMFFKIKRLFGGCALALRLTAAPAFATTYNVNLGIGAGSVQGTIETDGTVGTLSQSNITDWHLDLFDGTYSFTLIGNGSVGDNSDFLLIGSQLSATLTQLTYNFISSGVALFQAPTTGSGKTFFCIEGQACSFGSNQFSVMGGTDINTLQLSAPQSGLVVFGTVSAVPLPAGGLLLLGGLAGIARLRRRKGAAALA
ncbi:MAG: VPLPA-CTERM sorting domain-containing protein [Rhodobacterales bacterium]